MEAERDGESLLQFAQSTDAPHVLLHARHVDALRFAGRIRRPHLRLLRLGHRGSLLPSLPPLSSHRKSSAARLRAGRNDRRNAHRGAPLPSRNPQDHPPHGARALGLDPAPSRPDHPRRILPRGPARPVGRRQYLDRPRFLPRPIDHRGAPAALLQLLHLGQCARHLHGARLLLRLLQERLAPRQGPMEEDPDAAPLLRRDLPAQLLSQLHLPRRQSQDLPRRPLPERTARLLGRRPHARRHQEGCRQLVRSLPVGPRRPHVGARPRRLQAGLSRLRPDLRGGCGWHHLGHDLPSLSLLHGCHVRHPPHHFRALLRPPHRVPALRPHRQEAGRDPLSFVLLSFSPPLHFIITSSLLLPSPKFYFTTRPDRPTKRRRLYLRDSCDSATATTPRGPVEQVWRRGERSKACHVERQANPSERRRPTRTRRASTQHTTLTNTTHCTTHEGEERARERERWLEALCSALQARVQNGIYWFIFLSSSRPGPPVFVWIL